jgi:hypothetical protein
MGPCRGYCHPAANNEMQEPGHAASSACDVPHTHWRALAPRSVDVGGLVGGTARGITDRDRLYSTPATRALVTAVGQALTHS